jgi:hypothetical protein
MVTGARDVEHLVEVAEQPAVAEEGVAQRAVEGLARLDPTDLVGLGGLHGGERHEHAAWPLVGGAVVDLPRQGRARARR